MRATLLGTGDATSVPAPLCDCEFCVESDRRRHPSVLVESGGTRLLLDAGPDVQEQLHETDTRDADAVFLTHAHGDHSAGLPALSQAAKWDADHLDETDEFGPTPDDFDPGYAVHCTETARDHLEDRYHRLWLQFETVAAETSVDVGDCTVTAVPVEHSRPTFQPQAFVVDDGEQTLCYAPDMRRWHADPPAADVDLLVCEGAAVLGQPTHGPRDELRGAIDAVDADRTVLVNVNEHLQRAHTDELRDRARAAGYELGVDYASFEL